MYHIVQIFLKNIKSKFDEKIIIDTGLFYFDEKKNQVCRKI